MAFKRPDHGLLGLSFLACRVLQILSLLVAMSLTARFIAVLVDDMQAPPPPIVGILSVVCFAILYAAITVILYFDAQLPLLAAAGLDGLFFLALMITSIVIGKPLSYASCKASNLRSAGTGEFIESLGDNINKVPEAPTPTPIPNFSPYGAPDGEFDALNVATKTAYAYVTSTVSDAAATVAATLSPGGETQVLGSDGSYYTIKQARSLIRRGSEESEMNTISYTDWIKTSSVSECLMMKAVWGFGIALTILFVFSVACLLFIWKQQREPRAPRKGGEVDCE